jgi:hypothetical protein
LLVLWQENAGLSVTRAGSAILRNASLTTLRGSAAFQREPSSPATKGAHDYQESANRYHRVRHIEGREMPAAQVNIEEIGHSALAHPVQHIADGTTGNQATDRLRRLWRYHGPYEKSGCDHYADSGEQQRAIEKYLLNIPKLTPVLNPSVRLKNGATSIVRGGTITMLRISHFVTKSVASAAAKALPASAPRRVKFKYANEILLDMTSALHEVQRVENGLCWGRLGCHGRVMPAGLHSDAARRPPCSMF